MNFQCKLREGFNKKKKCTKVNPRFIFWNPLPPAIAKNEPCLFFLRKSYSISISIYIYIYIKSVVTLPKWHVKQKLKSESPPYLMTPPPKRNPPHPFFFFFFFKTYMGKPLKFYFVPNPTFLMLPSFLAK